jgi:hypothetical protein
MVVLFYADGHTERFPDDVLDTLYADTGEVQVINILTPEEIEAAGMEGVLPWQAEGPNPFTEAR